MSTSNHEGNESDDPNFDCDIEVARGHSLPETGRRELEDIGEGNDESSDYPVNKSVNDNAYSSEKRSLEKRDADSQSTFANSTCTPSIRRWTSIIPSAKRRRLVPMASSTPLLSPSTGKLADDGSSSQVPKFPSSSLSSIDDDSVLYYGPPMAGTSAQRRRLIFRCISSIEEEDTPSQERIEEPPKSSNEFMPKLTSTIDESGRSVDSVPDNQDK